MNCAHMIWHSRKWDGRMQMYLMTPLRQCAHTAKVPVEKPKWCRRHTPFEVACQHNKRLADMVAELTYMGLQPAILNTLRAYNFTPVHD